VVLGAAAQWVGEQQRNFGAPEIAGTVPEHQRRAPALREPSWRSSPSTTRLDRLTLLAHQAQAAASTTRASNEPLAGPRSAGWRRRERDEKAAAVAVVEMESSTDFETVSSNNSNDADDRNATAASGYDDVPAATGSDDHEAWPADLYAASPSPKRPAQENHASVLHGNAAHEPIASYPHRATGGPFLGSQPHTRQRSSGRLAVPPPTQASPARRAARRFVFRDEAFYDNDVDEGRVGAERGGHVGVTVNTSPEAGEDMQNPIEQQFAASMPRSVSLRAPSSPF
jgi:microcystin-dependent protein